MKGEREKTEESLKNFNSKKLRFQIGGTSAQARGGDLAAILNGIFLLKNFGMHSRKFA